MFYFILSYERHHDVHIRGVQIRKPETRGLLKIGRVFSNQKAANPWVSLKNKASLWPTRAQGGIYLVIYQHRLIIYQKNRIDLFFPILNFVLQDKCCIWQHRQKCDRNLRSFESIAFLPMLTNTTLILQNKAKIRKEEINAVLLVYNRHMVLNHLYNKKMLGERLVGEKVRQVSRKIGFPLAFHNKETLAQNMILTSLRSKPSRHSDSLSILFLSFL